MDIIKEYQVGDETLKISYDTFISSPREDCNFTIMVFTGRNYSHLGDKHNVEFGEYDSRIPDIDVLKVLAENDSTFNEKSYNDFLIYSDAHLLKEYGKTLSEEWLFKESEKFCRDKAVYNAILNSISIMDGADKVHTKEAIPSLLEEALAINFDVDIGHDYMEAAEERYEDMHSNVKKYPCHIAMIDKITNKGFEEKTLNVFAGSPGAGKTIFLCQLAKEYIQQGKDVLYITMEMADMKIGGRLDANIMNVNINNLNTLSQKAFLGRIELLKKKGMGKLIVKEYPTGAAHVGHFEALLHELLVKKGFVTKIIIVDYLNICESKTVNKSVGLYTYIKTIAEELRGMMIRHKAVGFSVTQFNRDGSFSSDAGHGEISESSGLSHTVDFLAGLLTSDELAERGRVLFRQIKNRYGDVNLNRKFLLGIDTNFMRYFSVDEDYEEPKKKCGKNNGKKDDEDDTPLFDRSTNGRTLSGRKGLGNLSEIKF